MPTRDRHLPRLDLGATYPRLVTEQAGAGSADDATLRAQAELILNAAGEGIYGLDLQGRCTFVNPAAANMTGHTRQELLGTSMHDLVHHSHPEGQAYPRESCPIYAAFTDGMVRNVHDEVFWRKDGSAFHVEYTSTPLFNGTQLAGAVVVFRDITLRRQTEAQLRGALTEVQRLKERLQLENKSLRRAIEGAKGLQEIVGSSAALRELKRMITRVASSDCTVLIQGETGTGKELVANALHRLSARATGPYVRVNCSTLSSQLADSELFGHERGAFTGAMQRRAGRFEQARSGTLFLDEVAELPLDTQAKLLRVLQEHEFERVGGNDVIRAEVRLLAATNRDLRGLVREGRFREDLYYRLNVLPLPVPNLRSRLSDIPALVEHCLHQLEQRMGRELGRVGEEGLRKLAAHSWPGNVRELHNVIERAAVLSEGTTELLPSAFEFEDPAPLGTVALGTPPEALRAPSEPPRAQADPSEPVSETLEQAERRTILAALTKTRWRLAGTTGASTLLGLHPNTLRHRMKKLGIAR
jgi:PAS domain S-box-containing protein